MMFQNTSHRRYNPLTKEWVLVSPHRTQRPWLGQVEKLAEETLASYDPDCYLCPNNKRVGELRNTDYKSTFVFDNDFPALLPPVDAEYLVRHNRSLGKQEISDLIQSSPQSGICRVVCFSPRHDLTLPELSQTQVEAVIQTWIAQVDDLRLNPELEYIQIFENKGAMMGTSNPHPHNQIWATSYIPEIPEKEDISQAEYMRRDGSCLLCDYLTLEIKLEERLVISNDSFSALVPFWAVWPFELLLLSNRHVSSLPELSEKGVSDLADIIRQLTTRYDNLFQISFPYSMGLHQSPLKSSDSQSFHLHAHYFPPLLRSATVRKFMVGFELLAEPQRDLTAESAAQRLRSVSNIHYRYE